MTRQGGSRVSWSRKVVCLELFLIACASVADAGSGAIFESVGEIRDAMYQEQKYFGGCFKLLNRTGPAGCAAPGRSKISAKLMHLADLPVNLSADRALVVGAKDALAFLARVHGEPALLKHIKMVLVLQDALPTNASSSTVFPGGAEYAPYFLGGGQSEYPWNPVGTGLGLVYLEVPIYLVDPVVGKDVMWRAQYNQDNSFKGSNHWAECELTMDAVQANSTACLTAGTCQPLGGFSVWAAMPPLPFNSTTGRPTRSGLPVTLVTAQVDSSAFFNDAAQAADATLSGLIAMLAAMDILRAANLSSTYTRTLVFAALPGETTWGYLGSKRLLWEMVRSQNESTQSHKEFGPFALGDSLWTPGLSLDDIDQVIEVGQVGRALVQGAANQTRLYLHSQLPGSSWGDTTSLKEVFSDAAQTSSTTDQPTVILPTSATNPGLPPSSLFSFLRVKPSIAAISIQEFDSQYTNPYFHSHLDNGTFINLESIVSTAILLARSLHVLASPPGSLPLSVNTTAVQDFCASLSSCLIQTSPGMSCPLAASLLNPDFQITDQVVSYAIRNYLSVLTFIHPDPQEPFYKRTTYRFLWNLMGKMAASSEEGAECAFQANQCPLGQECIGWKGSNRKYRALMGRCQRTTVRYVPALPSQIDFVPQTDRSAVMFFSNRSDEWHAAGQWPEEPLWTESNWPSTTPFIRFLQKETQSTADAIIISGFLATFVTAVVAWFTKAFYERHLLGKL